MNATKITAQKEMKANSVSSLIFLFQIFIIFAKNTLVDEL